MVKTSPLMSRQWKLSGAHPFRAGPACHLLLMVYSTRAAQDGLRFSQMPDGEKDASLWLDDRPAASRPALDGDVSADVAIVGGGVGGVALAFTLARSGASVALLEARHLAAAASGRNAGFVLAGVAENFVAASRRYGEANAERVWRFTRRSQELLREVVSRHAIACDLEWNGSLQIAGDDEEWTEMLAGAVGLVRRGIRATIEEDSRSVWFQDDGALHPVKLVRGVAAAAVGLGARIFESTPASGVSRGAVRTSRGSVTADAVVVCANAYAPRLVSLRVRPVRGQMLATAPLRERLLTRPVYAHRGMRYWRQTSDRRVLVGGWRDVALDEEVGEEERLNRRVQAALDGFLRESAIPAPVTHRWAGIMGFSHDGLPYLGRLPSGVFVSAGFTGHGLGFSFAAAELVAALILGEASPEAALFDPERA